MPDAPEDYTPKSGEERNGNQQACGRGGYFRCDHCNKVEQRAHASPSCKHERCRDRYRWRLIYRIVEAEPTRFLTLTLVPVDQRARKQAMHHFFRALRHGKRTTKGRRRRGDRRGRRFPIEYVCVFEFGSENGMHHAHILYRGPSIDWRILRARARAEGMGTVLRIYPVGDAQHVARYLGKYITKDLHNQREGHRYAASRGFFVEREKGPCRCDCGGEWLWEDGIAPVAELRNQESTRKGSWLRKLRRRGGDW